VTYYTAKFFLLKNNAKKTQKMSGQRAFAQKLNKQGAAEVRKAVSSSYFKDLPKSTSGISLASTQSVPLGEVVEPLDFEEYVYQHQNAIDRDSMPQLLRYPFDDLEVTSLPRKCRTIKPIKPDGADQDLLTRDCMQCYSADYTLVKRKYQVHSSSFKVTNETVERNNTLERTSRQEYEVDVEESKIEADKSNIKRQSLHSLHLNDTPRGSWASSVFDLKNSQADPLLPRLLDRIPLDETDQFNATQRHQSRLNDLYSVFPAQDEDEVIERRLPAEIPREHFGQRILVKCLQLKLELEIEPIFANVALYDARERKKISENFYFDMTPEPVKKMLGAHIPYQDISTLSRSCVFSITYPSPDVFLVIKLEKVLQQGDISEAAEPYVKFDGPKDKVKNNAVYFCDRLGKYRMPFAWTAIYLMNVVSGGNSMDKDTPGSEKDSLTGSLDKRMSGLGYQNLWKRQRDDSLTRSGSGSMERGANSGSMGGSIGDKRSSWSPEDLASSNLESFRPVTLTVSSFFKQESDRLSDDDLYKFLQDLKRPTSVLKRLKCIPGSLKLDISPCAEELKYCLSPELYKISPYPDEKSRPTKEICEFPSREVFLPNAVYRNLLYIYPKSLNFTNRQGSARNIAVKVQFMAGEDDNQALPVIFGKSSCPEYAREMYTSVTYHNKNPDFYDEIKVRLPGALGDEHHLLFTFYHISCQKKIDMTPLETPIGYTWLPLMREGHLVCGDFNLPVAMDRPPNRYSMLHPDVQLPGMKWVDNHKGLFNISLQAKSTVHPQDENIIDFLNMCHAAEIQRIPQRIGENNFENELKRSIVELVNAQGEPLVHFLPVILDKLIQLLVRPPAVGGQLVNIGQGTFECLAEIVRRLDQLLPEQSDHNGRNSLLTTYIQYQCTLPHIDRNDRKGAAGNLGTPPGNYASLSRPVSLPVRNLPRSSSDTELSGSSQTTPDEEVAMVTASRIDRTNSLRHTESVPYSMPKLNQVQSRKVVHEELVYQWVVSSGTTRDLALQNSWFILELMVKSMAEHLSWTGRIDMIRKQRFPQHFLDDVFSLVAMITRDIVDRYLKEPGLIKSLNTSLAFFIYDILSLMDRGFVFQIIKHYCKQVTAKVASLADATTLIQLKLDLLRIICSHEHYVQLNLPFGSALTPSAPSSPCPSVASSTSQTSYTSSMTLTERTASLNELSTEFRIQHFLVGLVLSDLTTVLDLHQPAVHHNAINLVRNILTSHDEDPRYVDVDVKARVAALYLPLLGIVMDALPQLYDPMQDMKNRGTGAENNSAIGPEGIDHSVAMAIASSSVYGGVAEEDNLSDGYDNKRKCMLGKECTRNLLVSFMWVVKNIDQAALKNWVSTMQMSRIYQLLEVLFFSLSNFEYKGKAAMTQCSQQTIKKSSDMKSKLEDVILGTGSARSDMMARRMRQSSAASIYIDRDKGPPSPNMDTNKLRWRKDMTHWKQTVEQQEMRLRGDVEGAAHIEGNLASEISLIALDGIEMIIQIISEKQDLESLLGMVLRVLLHGLALNQSTIVLQNMFATQRTLVSKYPELLFEEETEQCADLCLRLLHHCSCSIGDIRAHACASLYLLMRQNFEMGNNFARVKMQVTMSLSSLVGRQNQRFNEEYLRKSLKTILTYAETDIELQETSFPEQVRDLVFNLHMILSDTVKMKEFSEDPEMLIDLMYRIAKGYQNSPDLRLTWLQNMAAKHSERGNHAEAAHCLVHAAGLVAEYMNMLEDRPYLPIGCVVFQHISKNVLEESAVSDDVVSPDEEGICTGRYFTESGLIGLLEQAASSFNFAGMYEEVNEVYKVLIPIFEHNRDFKKLSLIHNKLHEAFANIIKNNGKRVFGTYFRVGFYGAKFGDLDGEEFIYKEPSITKLPEIAERLRGFFEGRFGCENVEMIQDSKTVEREKLNPEKAYIQITYVEPYFDSYEYRERLTYFERNYNIKRFMYATPFTLDGRAHGELQEQYKRKTVLTTNRAFPYVKTRMGVINREQVILSPIEVAIEDIQKKLKELSVALNQEPADPKMLQMVLQGCIGTTVNQGPVEVAMVFLTEVVEGRVPPSKHHNKLRICFKDFLKKTHDALIRNKTLIQFDQKEYQRELERNYHEIKEKLWPMITNQVTTLKRKTRNRDRERSVESRNRRYSSRETTPVADNQSVRSLSMISRTSYA
ncbi:unnamed protein product, partial [Owenia fusiformis]